MPADGGPAALAVRLGLQRLASIVGVGTLLVAAVWFVLAAPEPGTGSLLGGQWMGLAAALIVAASVLAILTLSPRGGQIGWAVPHFAALAVTGASLVSVLALKVAVGYVGWWPVVELIAIGALVAAAVLPRLLWSLVAGGVVILVANVMVVDVNAASLFLTPPQVIAKEMRLVVVFATVAVFAWMIRRFAGGTDAQFVEAKNLAALSGELSATEAGPQWWGSYIHDTLMQLLTQISLDPPTSQYRAISNTCARRVAVWRGLLHETPGANPIAQAVTDVQDLGRISVTDTVSGDPMEVPYAVMEAVAGAVRELLRNVQKHAGGASARVTGDLTADFVLVTIVDNGHGFRIDQARQGMGLRESIWEPCNRAGVSVDLQSEPGKGTTATLTWDANDDSGQQLPTLALTAALWRALAWTIGVASTASILAVLANWAGFHRPWLALVLLTVTTSALVLMLVAVARSRYVRQAAVVCVILAVGVLLLVPLADTYCSTWLQGAPLPDNRILLLIVPVLLLQSQKFAFAATAVYVGAAAVAAVLWGSLWPACNGNFFVATMGGAVLVLGAGQLAAVVAHQIRLAARVARDLIEQRVAAARFRLQPSIIARWDSPTVESTLNLLEEVRRNPAITAEPKIQEHARQLQRQLRGHVACASASGPVADALHVLVDRWARTGSLITVVGDFTVLDEAEPGTGFVAQRLTKWIEIVDFARVDHLRIVVSENWQGPRLEIELSLGDDYAPLPEQVEEEDQIAEKSGLGATDTIQWGTDDYAWWWNSQRGVCPSRPYADQ